MSTAKLLLAVLVLVPASTSLADGYYVWGGYGSHPVYAVYGCPPPVVYAPPPVLYALPPARVVYEEPQVLVHEPEVIVEEPPVVQEAPEIIYESPPVVTEPCEDCVQMRRHKRGEAEIDSLDVKGRMRPEGLEIRIRYEVELEDMPLGAADLMIEFSERGRTLAAADGTPFGMIVQLTQPTEVDDDEYEIKGRATTLLPHGTFMRPDKIRVNARIVEHGTGAILDRESEELDD